MQRNMNAFLIHGENNRRQCKKAHMPDLNKFQNSYYKHVQKLKKAMIKELKKKYDDVSWSRKYY